MSANAFTDNSSSSTAVSSANIIASAVTSTDGVVKEASSGCGDSLDDIPTLSDLAKQSPKVIIIFFPRIW